MPSKATVEAPSGTDVALLSAVKLKFCSASGPELEIEKANVPGVGSNEFPEIVPNPVTFKKESLCPVTVDDVKSNVKPPTDQSPDRGVEGLNTHGEPIVTAVPVAIPEKDPVWMTDVRTLVKLNTSVAVDKG